MEDRLVHILAFEIGFAADLYEPEDSFESVLETFKAEGSYDFEEEGIRVYWDTSEDQFEYFLIEDKIVFGSVLLVYLNDDKEGFFPSEECAIDAADTFIGYQSKWREQYGHANRTPNKKLDS